MDGHFKSTGVTIDAAMQDGLGLLSYIKLYSRTNSSQHLAFASLFARYLTQVRGNLLHRILYLFFVILHRLCTQLAPP